MNENTEKPATSLSKIPNQPMGISALDAAFDRLPAEQQQRLIEKAMEQRLQLQKEAEDAQRRHVMSSQEMQEQVDYVRDLESRTKTDFTVRGEFRTGSGTTNVEIKKATNTVIIVVTVAIVIVVLVLMMMARQ